MLPNIKEPIFLLFLFTSYKYSIVLFRLFKFCKSESWTLKRVFYGIAYGMMVVSCFLTATVAFITNINWLVFTQILLGASLTLLAFTPCEFNVFKRSPGKMIRRVIFILFGITIISVAFAIKLNPA